MIQNIILAAGEHTRFNSMVPKQLLKIGSETIIHRQDRQFGFCILATQNKTLLKAYEPYFKPHEYQTILHTLRSCLKGCQDVNKLFLLGDVYFTEDAATRIKEDSDSGLRFYHSDTEIFAIRISKYNSEAVIKAIDWILNEAKKLEHYKLWTLYRFLHGLKDLNAHQLVLSELSMKIDDYTQDFDTMKEYEDWRNGLHK